MCCNKRWNVIKFASKDLTVLDLKDIYEDIPVLPRTENTQLQQPQHQQPKSKVKLRTDSKDEFKSYNNRLNNIKETIEKLTNAFLVIRFQCFRTSN